MKYRVDFSRVISLLTNYRVPREIVDTLQAWAAQVEKLGLPEVRKVQRYRDHALKVRGWAKDLYGSTINGEPYIR